MKINELKSQKEITSVYHLDFGTVTMFETYLVTEFKEGILLNAEKYLHLATLVQDHFSHLNTFGYVANRMFPYAVVPTDLINSRSYITPDVKVAIVNYDDRAKESSIFEKSFYPFKTKIFDDLSSALYWT